MKLIYTVVDVASYRTKIIDLYDSVGWVAYTKKPEQLVKGLNQSKYVLGAFMGDELVGLIRVVGDGATIAYIQDILVHPTHQRQGIGSTLVKKVLKMFSEVRQIVLLTDAEDQQIEFYNSLGFSNVKDKDLNCFVRFDH